MSQATFKSAILANFRSLWSSQVTTLDFADSMYSSIRRGFNQAWIEGALACNVKANERTDEEQKRLDLLIGDNFQYVGRLADWIFEHSKDNGYKFSDITYRADEWIARYTYVQTIGREMACENLKELWTYGPTEHCFLAGTMITCRDGDKEIQDIKIGDKVWTIDGWKPVVKLFKRPYYGNLIEVRVKDRVVVSTPEHPYLTQRGWISANQLKPSDNAVLFQDLNNAFVRHILLPYTFNDIATRCQILILSLVTLLLGLLPIGQWFKSWMTMPVVTIGLNNEIVDSDIDNKSGLNQIVRFIDNAKFGKVCEQSQFKLGWFGLFKFPVSLKQLCYHSFFFFRISVIKFFSLLLNAILLHWIVIAHVFTGFRMNDFMRHFFGQGNLEYTGSTKNLLISKPKFFSNLLGAFMRIMNPQVFISVFRPQFGHVSATVFTDSIGAFPADRASFFGNSPFGFATSRIVSVSTSNRAESISSIRVWFVTLFAKLHHSNTPLMQILYHKRETVYNFEVEGAHHYSANGFIVHNCCDCLRMHGRVYRNSIWAKYGIEPQSPNLACFGGHCRCKKTPTDLPVTKGRPPALRGPGGCGKAKKKELT